MPISMLSFFFPKMQSSPYNCVHCYRCVLNAYLLQQEYANAQAEKHRRKIVLPCVIPWEYGTNKYASQKGTGGFGTIRNASKLFRIVQLQFITYSLKNNYSFFLSNIVHRFQHISLFAFYLYLFSCFLNVVFSLFQCFLSFPCGFISLSCI